MEHQLLESIKRIENRLTAIEEILLKNSKKMESHINFIETTYNTVRAPLNYIKNRVELIIGGRGGAQNDLLPIKNNETN